MNTAEFLRSPRFQEAAQAFRERYDKYQNEVLATDTGAAERGDIRTIRDPRDWTDLQRLVVLNVHDSVAYCHLVTGDEVWAATSDIMVKGHSAYSSAPYDLVLDGVLFVHLPVTALGSLVGRVPDVVVRALTTHDWSELEALNLTGNFTTDGIAWNFTEIAGHMDIRWQHRELQHALVRALEQHHPTDGPPPTSSSTQ